MEHRIAVSEFKAKCLHLLDEVQRSRLEIVVTKRGKVVARVVPAEEPAAPIVGRLKGSVRILGDIIGPTGEKWEADE